VHPYGRSTLVAFKKSNTRQMLIKSGLFFAFAIPLSFRFLVVHSAPTSASAIFLEVSKKAFNSGNATTRGFRITADSGSANEREEQDREDNLDSLNRAENG